MQLQATLTNPLDVAPRWPLKAGLVAAAHLANDTATSMLPALLPFLGSRLGLAPAELAVFVSLFAVGSSLPQPLFGVLADRLGRHRVGAVGLAVSGALVASFGFVSSVPWLCAVLLLGGLGSSALHPAGIGLARAALAGNPGLAVAVFSAAGMAGGGLGPLLAIGITSTKGFEGLVLVAVPVMVVAGLLARFAPLGAAIPERASLRRGLRFMEGPTTWLALVAVGANVAMLTFMSAVPMWLVNEKGISPTSPVIGATLAAFSLASAGGGLLGGVLVKRLPRVHLIVGSLAFSVAALESVLVTRPGSAEYFVAVTAAGAFLYLHAPLLLVRAQELSPGAESAVAGILVGGTSAVAGLIYGGLGAAQEAFGIGATMAASFLLPLPAAHVARVVLRSVDAVTRRSCTACRGPSCASLRASLNSCAPDALACAA